MRIRRTPSTRSSSESRSTLRRLGAASACMRACVRVRARACASASACVRAHARRKSRRLAACAWVCGFVPKERSMVDAVVDAVKALQAILDDAKENVDGGLHLRLCNAAQVVFDTAEALKEGNDDEESDEESEPEPEERTEDDMGLNELSELWGWQFDFGRDGAVLPLEGLIYSIVEDDEAKRVCAALRVINAALRGSNPDDAADAERILSWKEALVEERVIFTCGGILEKTDARGFHREDHEENWMYSVLCDEIIELFRRLGKNDALFRTKMRRNGVRVGVGLYAKEHPNNTDAQFVHHMVWTR